MRQRTAFTPFFRVGGKSCVVGRLKRSWAVSFPNLVEVDTFSMSEGLRQHLLFYVTIQRCQEGGMDMGFHCGDNTDYQYRKPSWALGQEEILPSISTHNLQTKGWQQLHLQAIGSPYMGGRISSCLKPRWGASYTQRHGWRETWGGACILMPHRWIVALLHAYV